ncbi:MFS-type transporter SLC18B1-like [Clytia hemisphaerica]|uniref:MFS-type transporter SLC18B1-like n=1 Tax=Clytia hemisphaerica TaxID=252671 RepID=UPI0034D3FE99
MTKLLCIDSNTVLFIEIFDALILLALEDVKSMPKLGVKFSMIGGSFVQGCSLVILGSLDYIEDDQLFLIYCFILRVVMAVGAAGCETGCLSIVSISFKHRMSTAQGVMSGSSGVGLMLGPVIGGVLYKFGGFKLPLMSIGVLICSAAFLTFFVLPEEATFRVHRHDDQTVSFLKVITIPGIFIMGTVSLTAGMVISFLDPTLTNYVEVLTDNSVSSALVGLIFLCIPVTYTVFTPILGYLIDKKISGRYACIIGAYLGGICFLFIGPCPLFFPWIEPNLWLLIGVLLALGAFSITSLFVPVLNEMQLIARKANLPLGMGTDSILSGIYTANFNLGSMVGPTLGGALTDNLQFPWASAAFGALLLFEATLLLIFTVLENICSRKKKIKQPIYNGMGRGRPRLSSTNIVPYHQICDPRIDSTAALPTIESSGEEYITRVGDRVSVRAYQQPRYDRFLPSPKEEDEHFMEKSCEIIEENSSKQK